MTRRRKALPPPPAGADPQTRQWMESVQEHLEVAQGVRGSNLDQFVAFGDIVDIGLAKFRAGVKAKFNSSDLVPTFDETQNRAVPPAPENVQGVAGIGFNTISFRVPFEQYGNHAYAEVWRAEGTGALLGAAVKIGIEPGTVYPDFTAAEGIVYVYWIRFVSTAGITGPFHNSSGLEIETLVNADFVLEDLEGQLGEIYLTSSLAGRIDLIDTPSTGILARLGSAETDLNSISLDVYDGATGLSTRASQADLTSLTTTVDGKAEASTVNQLVLDVSDLDTEVGGVVTQVSTIQGDIDGILAEWAVQVVTDTADGAIMSGISLMNGGGSSTFQVLADNLAIWDPGPNYAIDNTDKALVIGYTGGQLGIDGAYMRTATIDDAAIANLNVSKLTAGELTAGAWIKGGDFYGGQLRLGVGGAVRPDENGANTGYSFVVDSDGAIEMDGPYLRTAVSGERLEWNSDLNRLSFFNSSNSEIVRIGSSSAGYDADVNVLGDLRADTMRTEEIGVWGAGYTGGAAVMNVTVPNFNFVASPAIDYYNFDRPVRISGSSVRTYANTADVAEQYRGSSPTNLSFPIGHPVFVKFATQNANVAPNASFTIYVEQFGAGYNRAATSGNEGALLGTWRCRGTVFLGSSGTCYEMQRTA